MVPGETFPTRTLWPLILGNWIIPLAISSPDFLISPLSQYLCLCMFFCASVLPLSLSLSLCFCLSVSVSVSLCLYSYLTICVFLPQSAISWCFRDVLGRFLFAHTPIPCLPLLYVRPLSYGRLWQETGRWEEWRPGYFSPFLSTLDGVSSKGWISCWVTLTMISVSAGRLQLLE